MKNKGLIKEIMKEIEETRQLFTKMAEKCEVSKRSFKSPWMTDDKHEAAAHEFWRGKENSYKAAAFELTDLLEIFEDLIYEDAKEYIQSLEEEDVQLLEAAEEFDRDQRNLPW